MNPAVERVARALFLAEHPGSEWSAGRARAKWFFLAEAAIQAMPGPPAPTDVQNEEWRRVREALLSGGPK